MSARNIRDIPGIDLKKTREVAMAEFQMLRNAAYRGEATATAAVLRLITDGVVVVDTKGSFMFPALEPAPELKMPPSPKPSGDA